MESVLKAQLIALNDTFLEGKITRVEWLARLKDLNAKAENLGINLFQEAN